MGRSVTEAVWQERQEFITRWQESGSSLAEFARRNAVPYSRALTWRARFVPGAASTESPAGFAEVVIHSEAAPPSAVEIVLPSGTLVRVHPGADQELVRLALRAAVSC
jgi:hypothetical protein